MDNKIAKKEVEGILRKITFFRVFLVFVLAGVVGIGGLIYHDDRYLYEGIDYIDTVTQQRLGLAKKRDELVAATQSLNPLAGPSWVMKSGVPIYNIKLSPDDIRHFAQISKVFVEKKEKIDSLNVWRKATVSLDAKEHDIKIKIHGTAIDHYHADRKSFSIKSKEPVGDEGLLRFVLMVRPYPYMLFYNRLLEKLDIVKVRSDIVVVLLNNVYQGLYTLEEKLDEKLLELNGLPGAAVLKSYPYYDDHFSKAHTSAYDATVFGVDTATVPKSRQPSKISSKSNLFPADELEKNAISVAALKRLYSAISANDINQVKSMVDTEMFAAVEAFRLLTGQVHFVTGDNARLIFDFASGKFKYIYPRPESGVVKYNAWYFPFEKQFYSYEPGGLRPEGGNALLSLLAKDREFRQSRNEYLYRFVSMRAEIEKLYDDIVDEFDTVIGRQEASREKVEQTKDLRAGPVSIKRNLDVFEDYLSYARAHAVLEIHNGHMLLRVSADANVGLIIDKIKVLLGEGAEIEGLGVFKESQNGWMEMPLPAVSASNEIDLTPSLRGESFSNSLDEDFQYKFEETRFRIDGVKLGRYPRQFGVKFQNRLTGIAVDDNAVNLVIADFRSFETTAIQGQDALSALEKAGATISQGSVVFDKGSYTIDQTVILPEGIDVTIKPGTQLLLGKDVSFVMAGQLSASGTQQEKIVITSQRSSQPFGSFVVLGKSGNRCELRHFEVMNGSEALYNGLYSSGALFINDCDTEASSIFIHDNKSEDGMNVKNAKVNIRNSVFSGNFADQLDLDAVKGMVVDTAFVQGKSSNGDGLDLSASRVIIRRGSFEGFLDKGVSVGEASEVVITQSKFENNKLAIAVKDASKGYLRNNYFHDNDRILDMYVKKKFFASPMAIWEGSKPKEYTVDTSNGATFDIREPMENFERNVQSDEGISKLFDAKR